jgi:sugar phosphate isomerase/epimerase
MKQIAQLHISRRGFIGTTAAAAALAMAPGLSFGQSAKPNSKFNGVQIGTITYSYRGMPGTADDILNYVTQCGISSIELMGEPVEEFAGAPTFDMPSRPRRGEEITDEQRAQFRAAMEKRAKETREWRTSVSMDKFKELRQKYNNAGVNIHIVKFGSIGPEMTEDQVHYFFEVAKVLGAQGITAEISEEKAKYLGPIADEHQIKIGFHNHTQVNAESYDKPLSYGKYLAINLDIGHYVAGTNESPLPLIEKYGDAGRILSLHIKDRKVNNGPNMPFGHGDTPLALALQLMKKKGYTFPADIELEYPVPEDSDAVAEVTKCVQFCENALADPPERPNRGRMR